jgi:hypothetical protein
MVDLGTTYQMTAREREIMRKRTGRMDMVEGYRIFSCKEKGWRAEFTDKRGRRSIIDCASRQEAIDVLVLQLKEEECDRVYYRLENRNTGEVRYDWAGIFSMGFDDTKWIQTPITREEYFRKQQELGEQS